MAGSGLAPGERTTDNVVSSQAMMWKAFSIALASQSLFGIDSNQFKICSGLAVADWEHINYTGLPTTGTPGTTIPENVYAWADSMPDYASPYYLPGRSLYNQYVAFINALKVSPRDAPDIEAARSKLKQADMTDTAGNNWSAYRISPSLNYFMQASLQGMVQNKPKQIRFSIALPTTGAAAQFLPCALSTPGSNQDAPFFGFDDSLGQHTSLRQFAAPQCSSVPQLPPAKNKDKGACERSDSARIEFEAQTMQLFKVSAARWFDSGILSGFCDQIDPASALANKPMFGPDGLLNVRTSQILVAIGRKVVIHLGATELDKCKSMFMTPGRTLLNIGGFCFDSEHTNISSQGDALILSDNTDAPYVVGVMTDVLGRESLRFKRDSTATNVQDKKISQNGIDRNIQIQENHRWRTQKIERMT